MELREQIIEKEKAFLSFEVRHSIEKLTSLLSKDFREIDASGSYSNLKEVCESYPKEERWSAQVDGFNFRMLSLDIVQLTFRAFMKRDENDDGVYSLRSSIWRNESGTWKMVFHQGTEVPPFEITS